MGDYESQKELSYEMLLLAHLGRLSYVSTALQSDLPAIDAAHNVAALQGLKTSALRLGVATLSALIPQRLHDKTYIDAADKLREGKDKDGAVYALEKLQLLINLLDRKGLLMKNKKVALAVSGENVTAEVWEE